MRREFDYEGLKARLDAKHRMCIPTGRFEKIQPLPVPRSSRSPTGARPTDHQRCFTTAPILPPIRPRHQATGRWAAEGGSLSSLQQQMHDISLFKILQPANAAALQRC